MEGNLKLSVKKKQKDKSLNHKSTRTKVIKKRRFSNISKAKSTINNIYKFARKTHTKTPLPLLRRSSLRIRNKKRTFGCTQTGKSVSLEKVNLSNQPSDDSVIYIKTIYRTGSSQNIPTIDLTESTTSLKENAGKDDGDSSLISASERQNLIKSASLMTVMQPTQDSSESIILDDSRNCSQKTSEHVWELRKSYNLRDVLLEDGIQTCNGHISNINRNQLSKERKINNSSRQSSSDPLICDEIKVSPLLEKELNVGDINSLSKMYNISGLEGFNDMS